MLYGKTVIEHTLARLTTHSKIEGVVVALGENDSYWPELNFQHADKITTTLGGAERCHSVLNGLTALQALADDNDWVMVHDAARPCLHPDDIDNLIASLADHPVGGLLGLPVTDTMKRTQDDGDIIETVSREKLWRAMTPQMFRLAALRKALEKAIADDYLVTDDASAMEHSGQMPLMVEGHSDNIKITHPADLKMAEFYLHLQASENC